MMKSCKSWLTSLAVIVSLASCFLPDNYSATITISENRVTLVYDGDITFLPLYADIKSGKGTPEEHEKFMTELMTAFKNDVEIKKMGKFSYTYEGNARSEIHYSVDINLPESPGYYKEQDPFHLFGLHRTADGQIRLSSAEIHSRDIEEIRQFGLSSSGDICVKTDGKVIEHNADSEPGLFSSCYEWHLDSLSGKVASIVVKF